MGNISLLLLILSQIQENLSASILGHPVYDVAYGRACMRVGVSARAVAPFVYPTHMCAFSLSLSLCLRLCLFFFYLFLFLSSAAFKGIYVTGTCVRGTGRPTLWTPLFAKGPIYSILLSPSSPPALFLSSSLCTLHLPVRGFFLSNRDSLSRRVQVE